MELSSEHGAREAADTELSATGGRALVDRHSVDNAQPANERLGVFTHELRNHVHAAMLAVSAIKAGGASLEDAAGRLLERSLAALRDLVDRSLSDVRVGAGMPAYEGPVVMADFVAEVEVSATLHARARYCRFTVAPVEDGLAVHADRQMLFSAVANLLQNAFKFTRRASEVSLTVHGVGDRVLIEVADCCGGLPAGAAAGLFAPFRQAGSDRSGVGLGLSITRRIVEASNGVLRVRDLPGTGCVFTVDLPRQSV